MVRPEATADVDELETLDYGGCPTDPKGARADVEENLMRAKRAATTYLVTFARCHVDGLPEYYCNH